jgi:predicted enzyme related to lactoylglutathione lyase
MSQANSSADRIVWCDIPVADLKRASAFYRAVLAIKVDVTTFDGTSFAIFEHDNGTGGCLVPHPGYAGCTDGPLVYLNVAGRIRDAAAQAGKVGGKVVKDVHAIGPHGFCAIVLDSEGNRVALHSTDDR